MTVTPVRLGTDSSGRPILVSPYMADWWDAFAQACADFEDPFVPVITQGAFMAQAGGGAAASAGYHDLAGCLDLRVWHLNQRQLEFQIRQPRRMAAASWLRNQVHGGMEDHEHLVLGPDHPKAAGAADQWTDYLGGDNGLTGRSAGRDYHWRPEPLVTTWTPAQEPKPTVNITAALQAPDLETRKRALRRVIKHGSKPARRAARTWLAALLAKEAAIQKARVARGDLRDQEVR